MRTISPAFRLLRARCAWIVLIAVVALACALGSVRAGVTFGDTIAQCDAALGANVPVPNATYLVCAQTRGYVKDGLAIFVGFTERGTAEEFIYSKKSEADSPPADLDEAECTALLDQHKEGSSWALNARPAEGPIWRRADNGAFASYVLKGSRLVILSNEGMAEHTKKFNVKTP